MTSPGENVSPTAAPTRNARRYMPTPGKFVALLLLSVVALYLSDQYDWFEFNRQKGWTVLIAVAVAASGLGLIVVWSAVAYLFGRRAQFGLFVLMLIVPAVAVPLAWLTREVQQAKQLADAVRQIEQNGGRADFPYKTTSIEMPLVDIRVLRWLGRTLGREFFEDITIVRLEGATRLAEISSLHQLRSLSVQGDSLVSDVDLETLAYFPHLESIVFQKTEITDVGLTKIQSIPTLTRVLILESRSSRQGRRAFEEALAGKCEAYVRGVPRYENPYSLEFIEPWRDFDPTEDRADENLPDDAPPPPPPVGGGIWPYAKGDSP